MPASKVNNGKVLARVEELEVVCPGNALVWEFLQLKWLDRVELKDRINVMINATAEAWPYSRPAAPIPSNSINTSFVRISAGVHGES